MPEGYRIMKVPPVELVQDISIISSTGEGNVHCPFFGKLIDFVDCSVVGIICEEGTDASIAICRRSGLPAVLEAPAGE
jgi:hypothetical protein